MTHPALIERITRSLAYMLRHQPEKFDLELDGHGYGPLPDVVRALQERLGEPVDEADVEAAVEAGDRPRYEIKNGQIRALYGHSIEVEPGEPARPPEFLYVGIDARDLGRAQQFGLRGGRRRFLHLALNLDDAREAGRRAAREYSVLRIYALDAWEDGVNFFDRRALFLAEHVPTEYIEVLESASDGYEERVEEGGARRGGGGGRSGHGGRGEGRRDRADGRDRRPRGGTDRGGPDRGASMDRPHERDERAPAGERRPDRELREPRWHDERPTEDHHREATTWNDRPREESPREDGPRSGERGGERPRRDEPRREDGRRDDGRRGEPRREDSRRDEPRRDEPRRDDGRRDDGRRNEPRREDSRRDEPRRDDGQRNEPRRDDFRRDEPQRDDFRRDGSRGGPGRGRDDGRFSREPRSDGPRRGDRSQAPAAEDRGAPMAAPQRPEIVVRSVSAAPSTDFGLGIFDDKPVTPRPAPVEPERRASPPPPPPAAPREPASDFGAGL